MGRESSHPKRHPHRQRRIRVLAISGVMILLLLIGFRIALPHLVHRYVNHTLDRHVDYDGRIGEVDVHLIRGAYSIDAVNILKTTGDVPIPFFAAERVDFSMDWSELVRGSVVGEAYLFRPEMNFINGPTSEESQTEVDRSWLGIVEDLFPFKINRAEVHQGKLRYVDEGTEPTLDIYITNIAAVCTNLTNARDVHEKFPSTLVMRGTPMGNGKLAFEMRFNPMAERPFFDLNLALDGLDLHTLNDFFRAYAGVDVESGVLRLFLEIAVENGQFDGYIKPLLEDLSIIDLDEQKNPLQHVWEIVVAGLTELFENQPKDRLATRIPLSGTVENVQFSLGATLFNVLRNAFIEAFRPRLDLTVGQDDSAKPKQSEPQGEGPEKD